MRLRRLTTMLRRASSILSTRHLISLPMYSPMSCGRRISTWLAGRNTLTPISTKQAALDLARDLAGDDVALVDGLHDLHPLFDLLGLALAEDDHAAIVLPAGDVFDVFDEDANRLADLGHRVAFLPLVAGDDAFALVADVDEDEVVVDAQHFAFDDLIGADVAAARANPCPPAARRQWRHSSLLPKRRTHELRLRLTMQKGSGFGGQGSGLRSET